MHALLLINAYRQSNFGLQFTHSLALCSKTSECVMINNRNRANHNINAWIRYTGSIFTVYSGLPGHHWISVPRPNSEPELLPRVTDRELSTEHGPASYLSSSAVLFVGLATSIKSPILFSNNISLRSVLVDTTTGWVQLRYLICTSMN